jgi:hypothetical protein
MSFILFMPKTKTTKKLKTKPKSKLPAKSTDKERINLLKSELSYFKGLSIMAVVLILCVFFAFGSLFSAMYLEVQSLRYSFEIALDQAAIAGINLNKPAIESSDVEKVEVVEEEEISWINFEKYGFRIHFPASWTYLDNPYKNFEKTVDLYSDGKIHDYGETRGNVIVRVVNEWEEPELYTSKKEITLNDSSAVLYTVSAETELSIITLIENDGKFIELSFNNLDTSLISKILSKFELTQ